MSDQTLLDQVEHALCCPSGECRALAEGVPKDCSAKKTKEHAEAAIAIVQAAYRPKIKALVEIRKTSTEHPIIKLASDALA